MSASPPDPGEAGNGRLRFAPYQGLLLYVANLQKLSRNARLFLTITAFRGLVIASLQTVLNLYLYSLGFDARLIGLINGVNSLANLAVSIPLGFAADRFGLRPVLVFGGLAYPISLLGVCFSSSVIPIMAFMALFGAAATAYWATGIPLLFSSTSQEQRPLAFSINSFLLWGIGPLGALVSGQATEVGAHALHVSASSTTALRFGMLTMFAFALLGSIPYLFLRHLSRSSSPEEEPREARGTVSGLFVRLLVPDLILSFGMGSVLTFVQLFFHLRFALDPGGVGVVVALGGVLAGVGTLTTPLFAKRRGNLVAALTFQRLAVPAMLLLALVGHVAIAIPAYWLLLALRGMNDPVYTAFIQEQVPEAFRARLTSLYNVTYGIGYSFGPAVSGQLQKMGGFTPAFSVGAAAYLAGSLFLGFFFRGSRRPSPVGR